MVGVAKGVDRDAGKEEFHRTGQRPFALRHNDPVLYFVQRMRDEAHRFAIGTHRAKRAKSNMKNPLDEDRGRRRGAQAGSAGTLWICQGCEPCQSGGSEGRGRRIGGPCAEGL